MDPKDGRVVSNLIVQAIEGKQLTIYGNGSQTRSFCYIDDLVEGLISLMNSNYNSPVNLGNSKETTILELVEKISEGLNEELSISFTQLPVDDPKRRRPNIDLAKRELKWSPKVSLKEGLIPTIDWFQRCLNE